MVGGWWVVRALRRNYLRLAPQNLGEYKLPSPKTLDKLPSPKTAPLWWSGAYVAYSPFFFFFKTVKHVKLASTTHFCPIPRTVFGVPPLADRLTGYPAGRCARILPPRVNSRRFLIPRKSAVPVIWMTHVVSPVIFSPSTLPFSPSPARSLPVHLPSCPRHTALVPTSRRRYSNPWPARPRP